MISKDVILKPMLQLALGRALGFATTFMIPVVLVRVLDQSEFGTYKQLFLVYATLSGIAPIGMAECLYFFLPADPARAGRFIANSLVVLFGSGVFVLLLLMFGGHALAAGMDNPLFAPHATLLGIFVWLTMMSAVTEIVMITRHQHRLSAVTYTVSDALRALCLVLPALLWRDVHSVMMGAALFAVIRGVGTIVYTRFVFGYELRPDFPLLRKQLAYALPFSAAVTLEITQGSLHQFVVAHLYDTPTFAIYSVGCLQIPLVDFLATGAGSVLMVKMGERLGPAEHGARLELWHEAVRKLSLLLFPLVALLLVAGRELIIVLFTERFQASVPIFLISSLTIALAALPTDSALRTYSSTGVLVQMNVVRLLVVAVSVGPLLSIFGLPGAAVSVVLGTVAVKIFALVRFRRMLDVPVAQLLPWRDLTMTFAVVVAAALIAWGAKNAFVTSTFVSMIIAGLVFVAAYAGGATILGMTNGSAPEAPAA
jgi:O-antigen/teichoic acid export membrane protein